MHQVFANLHQSRAVIGGSWCEAASGRRLEVVDPATGVVIGVRSALPPAEPLIINANRPFLWAVIDSSTGSMLFAGQVADPRG